MIPILPQDTSQLDVCEFYKQIVDNLEMRSGHHEAWHTHKRDSSVCWICDLVEVSKIILREMERYISKSALDIEDSLIAQEFGSEVDTVNYNKDDENLDGISSSRKRRKKTPGHSFKGGAKVLAKSVQKSV